MKKCIVLGASGYSGSQLIQLILQHPKLQLIALAVSSSSDSLDKSLCELFPEFCSISGASKYYFQSWEQLDANAADIIFLATPHELSAQVVPSLIGLDKKVIDLSGAFRLKDVESAWQYYEIEGKASQLLAQSVYGLPELTGTELKNASLIAVAGCYSSVSILSLAPLVASGVDLGTPIINAVSGVSGAGRGAKLGTSFCEISLQAYGVGNHRHSPEIEQAIKAPVVFTPHVGNFKRGIFASVTLQLSKEQEHNFSQSKLHEMYQSYYDDSAFVKIVEAIPAIHHVEKTPFVHIAVRYLPRTHTIQIFGVIDNLMKGAASAAIQCCNLSHNWAENLGLYQTNTEHEFNDSSK
ncbi:MAG: N-acetyl-gamma-glutamyl-phosphate reductase [Gammaproteobacteria bacterium]|nr:N-acetyl-gamma-glutamyl-phosphate reductase [Gammaproteobacteria bacterium]